MVPATRITFWRPSLTPLIYCWWATFIVWHSVAMLVLARRLAGSLTQPLGWQLVLVAILICVVSAVIRLGVERLPILQYRHWYRMVTCTSLIAASAILGAVTLAGSSLLPAILSWGMLIATETMWLMRLFGTWPRQQLEIPQNGRQATASEQATQQITARPNVRAMSFEDESLPEGVTQQFMRSRSSDGETMSGLLRVEFAENERLQVVHLSFCPPFANRPSVEFAQSSGPEVAIQVTQAESFGARVEVKLVERASERCDVVIEFEALAMVDE